MERKIGEVFEYEGKRLVAKETNIGSCTDCFLKLIGCTPQAKENTGACSSIMRTDNKSVIFAEVKDEQPQELNLCEILKDCPKGTKFYSYIFGEDTYFEGVTLRQGDPRPVLIYGKYGVGQNFCLSRKGHPYADNYGECCIFPSKEMRDWSKFTAPWLKKERFDPKTLKAFDKVLSRYDGGCWSANLFSHIEERNNEYYAPFSVCNGSLVKFCIPYNDDTKHLVGTTEEAPDFYKYWED